MAYATLDAYVAAHKALEKEALAAAQLADKAEAALHAGITQGVDHDPLMELARKSKDADVERDKTRGAVAQIEKENPALEAQREQAANATLGEKVIEEIKKTVKWADDGANLNVVKDTVKVIENVAKVAYAHMTGTPIEPPTTDPSIKTKMSDGMASYTIQLGKEVAEDTKRVMQDASEVMAGLPAKAMDAAVEALPERARIALGGTEAGELEALGKPAATQNKVLADAHAHDTVGPAHALLGKYVADLHDGIANGAGYDKAELAASANLYENLTGQKYEKADGLHDAVRNELEQRHGEEAKHVYEDHLSAHLEQQQQHSMSVHGISQ